MSTMNSYEKRLDGDDFLFPQGLAWRQLLLFRVFY